MLSRERESGNLGIPIQPVVGNGFKIEFYRWGTDPLLLRSLQERAAVLNARVFRLNPLQTADEIYHHMQRDPSYRRSSTIATANNRDVAFCIQEFIEVPIVKNGQLVAKEPVIWTSLRAVESRYQGRGIGTAMIRKGSEKYADYEPRFYGGRTQAEPVFLSLIKSRLFSDIFPLTGDFKGRTSKVIEYLSTQVMYPKPVDPITGIVKAAYPEGETGGYALDISHSGIQLIHDKLEELGLEKPNGDAVIYLARPIEKSAAPVGLDRIVLTRTAQ